MQPTKHERNFKQCVCRMLSNLQIRKTHLYFSRLKKIFSPKTQKTKIYDCDYRNILTTIIVHAVLYLVQTN